MNSAIIGIELGSEGNRHRIDAAIFAEKRNKEWHCRHDRGDADKVNKRDRIAIGALLMGEDGHLCNPGSSRGKESGSKVKRGELPDDQGGGHGCRDHQGCRTQHERQHCNCCEDHRGNKSQAYGKPDDNLTQFTSIGERQNRRTED